MILTRVVVAAGLLTLTFLLIEFASPPIFLCAVALFMAACLFEARGLVRAYRLDLALPVYPLTLSLPWVWVYFPEYLPELSLVCLLAVLGWSVVGPMNPVWAFPAATVSFTVIFYLGVPFSLLAFHQSRSGEEIWLPLAAVWAGDIGAFLVGRRWGRHKITPRISPNKSLEGYVAAVVFASLAAWGVGGWLVPGRSTGFLLAAGAVTGFFGIIGDLFESQMKRGAGIKDTSWILPGHGGLLDRIDSLLLALPAYDVLTRLVE